MKYLTIKDSFHLITVNLIETDQKILKELPSQVVQTPEQHYYLSKLLGYDYDIVYKPGKENRVADALSRRDVVTEPSYMILSYLPLNCSLN